MAKRRGDQNGDWGGLERGVCERVVFAGDGAVDYFVEMFYNEVKKLLV